MTTDHLHEIIELAKTRGFEVETHNGWQRMFSLKDDEIALICNHCGEVIETSLSRPDLIEWISTLECPEKENCHLENDERLLTENGAMQWCKDCYGLVGFLVNAMKGKASVDPSDHFHFIAQIENIDTIYFAVNSQGNEPNEAYVFVICSALEGKKYALFRFENISVDGGQINIQAHMHNLWADFEETLASLIENQIGNPQRTNNLINAAALEASLDYYMYLAKVCMPIIVDIWEKPDKDDAYLRRYIKSHTCPVCGWPYTEKEKKCTHCGFSDIQRVFINIEEGQYWKTNTVPQYQNDFFHSHFEVSCGTVRKKTSDTEIYSIVIPEGVTCLGAKSFSEISKLRRVVCPNTLQEIGEEAFHGAHFLTYITLSSSLKSIGAEAFSQTKIKHIELPSGLEAIGEEAFWDCNCLEEIAIPLSVRSMGCNVFGGCQNLKHIYCEAKDRPADWNPDWVHREGSLFECSAQVHWGNTWHYDEYGKPCIDPLDDWICKDDRMLYIEKPDLPQGTEQDDTDYWT